MSSRSPTLEEVLRVAIRASLGNVHTAMPGRVEKYDAATQKADIKPLIKNVLRPAEGADIVESLPVITDVPVMFPRAGGFFISLPVAVGDHVLLVFNERSIDQFVTKGVDASEKGPAVDPIDVRTHNLSDAVAFVGFYPFTDPLADAHATNLVIGRDGGVSIHITPSNFVHLGAPNPAEFVALATKTLTELNKLKVAHDTHTHVVSGITAGPASVVSAVPVPLVAPLVSPAATKVKAE